MPTKAQATTVKWRFTGNGYSARVGRGNQARNASATSRPFDACRRAAAKFFYCNEDRVALDPVPPDFGTHGQCLAMEIPAPAGDIELSQNEFAALSFVAGYGPGEWVDIVSPELARRLTAIEQACPDLLGIIINPPADHIGTKPFLRATVTTVGREFIARAKGGA